MILAGPSRSTRIVARLANQWGMNRTLTGRTGGNGGDRVPAEVGRTLVLVVHCSSAATLADIISTVEFDSTGNYLATGDKGGRVVLFERNEMVRLVRPTLSLARSY